MTDRQVEPVRVLLVDDDEDDFFMLREMLAEQKRPGFDLKWVQTYSAGLQALTEVSPYDVVLLDYRLGERTGLDLLREAIAHAVVTPMILLTGFGDTEVDLEAMRSGAADYLTKGQLTSYLLERSIRYARFHAQAIQELRAREEAARGDLAARKEMEAQLLQQDRLASIGLLASSLAHEIGTPLGVIRGRAEHLAMLCAEPAAAAPSSFYPAVQKTSTVIVSQIDRVSQLIQSLLRLARGGGVQSRGPVSLRDALGEVLDLMAHEFKRNDITIKRQEGDADPVILAETGPLHQVLLNLLVNAVHAIESGRRKRGPGPDTIECSWTRQGKHWVFAIADSGCGISPENMGNLFKPFFTTKELGVGTGLGLATSFRILESWGARIHVQSELDRGTTFSLEFLAAE